MFVTSTREAGLVVPENVVRRKLLADVPDMAASGPPPGLIVSPLRVEPTVSTCSAKFPADGVPC